MALGGMIQRLLGQVQGGQAPPAPTSNGGLLASLLQQVQSSGGVPQQASGGSPTQGQGSLVGSLMQQGPAPEASPGLLTSALGGGAAQALQQGDLLAQFRAMYGRDPVSMEELQQLVRG